MGHQLSSWPQEGSNPEVPGRLAVWEVGERTKTRRILKRFQKEEQKEMLVEERLGHLKEKSK